jgi:hypothetical protein
MKRIWKHYIIGLVAFLAVGLLVFSQTDRVAAAAEERGGPSGRGNAGAGTQSTTGGAALTPLSTAEQTALQDAILEEYGAYNLYQEVIAQWGSVYPFSQIVRSEQQHINALVTQATKYGIEVPENPGLADTPVFLDLSQACQAGVDAEIADAALYDDLMQGTTHTDILRVYSQLQSASLNSHLPAFQTCD